MSLASSAMHSFLSALLPASLLASLSTVNWERFLSLGWRWFLFWAVVVFLPPVLLGIIRKTKARCQGRIGARIEQPVYDLVKMLRKGETLSKVTSWVFRSTAAINFAVVMVIAVLTPWVSFKPQVLEHYKQEHIKDIIINPKPVFGNSDSLPLQKSLPIDSLTINDMRIKSSSVTTDAAGAPSTNAATASGTPSPESAAKGTGKPVRVMTGENLLIGNITGSDLFLIIYMFAMARLFTVLSALDAGSAFGGFGASREVTVALLVEPAIILALASLGCAARTSDLNFVFSWVESSVNLVPLWFTAGITLYLASLIELSRMPVDDPTTHLELTMVHEAMILENSGRNPTPTKHTQHMKMTIMLGMSSQCLLHGLNPFFHFSHLWLGVLSVLLLVLLAVSIGLIESTSVKLRWTKVPEFIAYAVAMALLCSFIAVGVTS